MEENLNLSHFSCFIRLSDLFLLWLVCTIPLNNVILRAKLSTCSSVNMLCLKISLYHTWLSPSKYNNNKQKTTINWTTHNVSAIIFNFENNNTKLTSHANFQFTCKKCHKNLNKLNFFSTHLSFLKNMKSFFILFFICENGILYPYEWIYDFWIS